MMSRWLSIIYSHTLSHTHTPLPADYYQQMIIRDHQTTMSSLQETDLYQQTITNRPPQADPYRPTTTSILLQAFYHEHPPRAYHHEKTTINRPPQANLYKQTTTSRPPQVYHHPHTTTNSTAISISPRSHPHEHPLPLPRASITSILLQAFHHGHPLQPYHHEKTTINRPPLANLCKQTHHKRIHTHLHPLGSTANHVYRLFQKKIKVKLQFYFCHFNCAG